MSKEEVAEKATVALGEKIGQEPDDIACEDDLKAEVGETVRCELTMDGEKQGMTATAKSVDGDKVAMDFKVDDAPDADNSPEPEPSRPTEPTEPTEPTDAPSTGSGAPAVGRAEVARQGKAALAAQAGQEPDAFSCSQDLPARVNAVIRCQLSADGKQYGVTVTAKSVVGNSVKMDFKVDDTPNG